LKSIQHLKNIAYPVKLTHPKQKSYQANNNLPLFIQIESKYAYVGNYRNEAIASNPVTQRNNPSFIV